jgi:hypothetical protein
MPASPARSFVRTMKQNRWCQVAGAPRQYVVGNADHSDQQPKNWRTLSSEECRAAEDGNPTAISKKIRS